MPKVVSNVARESSQPELDSKLVAAGKLLRDQIQAQSYVGEVYNAAPPSRVSIESTRDGAMNSRVWRDVSHRDSPGRLKV